ncbi:MAG: histone deacetylase [Gemmatales bacterium]|nr:histone deacetylase [Gemmatales bacterium]MDW8223691.1 histone deacetylase [Gemmatales bacterium]
MTILYTDLLFREHFTGRHHPERPERLARIEERLQRSGWWERCRHGNYVAAAPEELEWIHDPGMIRRVRELCEAGGGYLDPDTVVSRASYQVALAAAGACASAVEAVLTGRDTTALCLVRPPGHHATRHESMGFCLFNNIAFAAEVARRRFGLERMLVVDWDVHHGNGTQDIFYDDDGVFFYSIHRYPFYPGTGAADETGTGRGLGYTLNVPVRYGTPRSEYHRLFRHHLQQAADKSRPQLVLISAGFDAHREDPIGSLGLEVEDFVQLTRQVQEVAQVHAQGRIVSCLEGGYHLERLAECVEVHLRQLAEGR